MPQVTNVHITLRGYSAGGPVRWAAASFGGIEIRAREGETRESLLERLADVVRERTGKEIL
jgi:hypothetical protein